MYNVIFKNIYLKFYQQKIVLMDNDSSKETPSKHMMQDVEDWNNTINTTQK